MKKIKVFHNISDIHIEQFSATTVGSFDGIHRGHQQILKALSELAGECQCTEVLVTFHPHPREVLYPSPQAPLELITPLEEKIRLLENLGLTTLVVIPFTRTFSQMGYREFVREILIEKLRMKRMVIGHDHAFGRNREGHASELQELGRQMDFSVTVIPPFYQEGEVISSSRIRRVIKEGNMESAKNLLGRPYALTGRVIRGESRGKQLGFPTANIQLIHPEKLIPKRGVYAVDIVLENRWYSGMMNIGHRPTFNFDPLTLEVHLFNFSGLIYDIPLDIIFKKFIREERKFSSAEELRNQILQDKMECLKIQNGGYNATD